MLKKIGWVAAGCAAAGVMGFKFTELGDYLRVVGRKARTAIAENVPTSVEVGRLELLMERIDGRLIDEEREHARAEANLEKAERDLDASRRRRDDWIGRLVRIREELRKTPNGCPNDKKAVEQEFAAKVAGCERLCKAIEDREAALAAQRGAVRKAGDEVQAMRRQREVLAHQLASLKSRDQAQRLAAVSSGRPAGDEVVRQAQELADHLTDRLELDRKVAERVAGWDAPTPPSTQGIDDAGKRLDSLLKRVDPPQTTAR